MEHFRTTRLIARDWVADDAQAAFDIYGRDEVMRWLGAEPRRAVASLAQMRERLDLMIQRGRDEPDYGLWAVELRAGPTAGVVVGAVLLSRWPAATARSRSAGTSIRITGATATPPRPGAG